MNCTRDVCGCVDVHSMHGLVDDCVSFVDADTSLLSCLWLGELMIGSPGVVGFDKADP